MQRIDRVSTASGVEVAYAVAGSGRPMVYVDGWLSHLELIMRIPEESAFFDALGRGRALVRYDRAGTGLSAATDRAPSLAFELEQLDAVVGTLEDAPFDLVGTSMGALVAAAWAAEHPARVGRLVLYGGWASGPDLSPRDVQQQVLALVETHWGLASDVLAGIFGPDLDPAAREDFARFQRACSEPATARALLAMSYGLDITEVLGRVTTPTLVVHREGDRAVPRAQAEALAAGVSGAELAVLPGRSHLPYLGDAHELVSTIRRFLGLRTPRGARILTPRQAEVVALVAEGLTNREIAVRLGIEERSAEGHVERIRLRLGVRSRAQLAAWWVSNGRARN